MKILLSKPLVPILEIFVSYCDSKENERYDYRKMLLKKLIADGVLENEHENVPDMPKEEYDRSLCRVLEVNNLLNDIKLGEKEEFFTAKIRQYEARLQGLHMQAEDEVACYCKKEILKTLIRLGRLSVKDIMEMLETTKEMYESPAEIEYVKSLCVISRYCRNVPLGHKKVYVMRKNNM